MNDRKTDDGACRIPVKVIKKKRKKKRPVPGTVQSPWGTELMSPFTVNAAPGFFPGRHVPGDAGIPAGWSGQGRFHGPEVMDGRPGYGYHPFPPFHPGWGGGPAAGVHAGGFPGFVPHDTGGGPSPLTGGGAVCARPDEAPSGEEKPAGQEGTPPGPPRPGTNGPGDTEGDSTAASRSGQSESVADTGKLVEALARAQETIRRLGEDLERMRRRSSEEVERRVSMEKAKFMRPWLSVLDSVERAVKAAENGGGDAEGWKSLREQVMALLKSSGLEEIDAGEGTLFDPRFHEALASIQSPEDSDGLIVETVEKGFMLDGKVLRPAKVVIVKN